MSDSPRRKWAKSQILKSHTLPPGTFPTSAQIRDYLKEHPFPGSPLARTRVGPPRGPPHEESERPPEAETGAPSRAEKPKVQLREVRPEVFVGPTDRTAEDLLKPPATPETPSHDPAPSETSSDDSTPREYDASNWPREKDGRIKRFKAGPLGVRYATNPEMAAKYGG